MIEYPPKIKSFQGIREEFEFATRSLSVKTNYYNRLISQGRNVPSAGAYYRYTTIEEAELIKSNLKLEIDRKYTLELIASFEAKSVYYFRNLKSYIKTQTPMYVAYMNLVSPSRRRGMKHLMYNHLIDVYKEVIMPQDQIVYSEFKNLVEFRNWLAHGRGWDMSKQHLTKYDFDYTYDIIMDLISKLPKYPDNLKA